MIIHCMKFSKNKNITLKIKMKTPCNYTTLFFFYNKSIIIKIIKLFPLVTNGLITDGIDAGKPLVIHRRQ